MNEPQPKTETDAVSLTVFWSWQTDSPEGVNRNFIEDCIKRAIKHLTKEDGLSVILDRDTEGVGGAPVIAETILKKIRSADVVVADVTLAYTSPRPAPNPNVAIEYGYALAVLGENKVVAVMNTATGAGPDELPFDLTHRRWPVQYSLSQSEATAEGGGAKKKAREDLVATLTKAIRGAAKEPRRSAFVSETDLHVARDLWKRLNTRWLENWLFRRRTLSQYEDRVSRTAIQEYVIESSRPELRFEDEKLRAAHDRTVKALADYLATLTRMMVPSANNPELFELSAVQDDWSETHDQKLKNQLDAVLNAAEAVWTAWSKYISELRTRYPEVLFGPN